MAEIATGNVEEQKSNSSPSSPNQKVPTDPEALALAVRIQVEYYFSKENLQTDTFLTSKMDAQKSVPIDTVMGFSKLKALTNDQNVVVEALKSSSLVVLENGRIKSIVKTGRSTIILREIPSDASEESVREIFAFPGCKPIASVRSEIGDTWFVTMESEEDAKDTLMDLKLKKRTFNGVSVKARLKTETVIRSYFPSTQIPAAAMGGYPMMPFTPYGAAAGAMADPNMQFSSGYGSGSENTGRNARQGRDRPGAFNEGNGERSPGSRAGDSSQGGAYGSSNSGSPRRDGSGVNKRQGGNGSNSGGNNKTSSRDRERDNNRKGGSQGNGGNGKGRDRKDGEGNTSRPTPPAPVIEINSSADFPPLPGDDHGPSTGSPAVVPGAYSQSVLHSTFSAAAASFTPAAAVIPPQGYQGPFIKYSIDDIMGIVSNIKEAVLPDTVQAADHPCAMTTTPNTDLLLRQRTFSIDETREQMQQGRPVHREAAIAGDVDYGSLIYGEDTQAGASQGGASQQKKKPATGGSWAGVLMKGGDAPPAPPAVQQKKPEPKPTPASTATGSDKKVTSDSNKKKGDSGNPRKEEGSRPKGEKKEKGQRGERRNRSDSKGGDGPPAQPQSWGGRPTFANVLKEKQAEAEAAAAKAAASPSAPSTRSATKPAQGGASTGRGGGGGNKGEGNKKAGSSAPEGAWGKEKLPPLRDGA